MFLDGLFSPKDKKNLLPPETIVWNNFISDVSMKDFSELTNEQKPAVLAFWYDAEVNSGGHSGYFDYYSNIQPEELIQALAEIGAFDYIENFRNALLNGKNDDYQETDRIFGSCNPSLTELLQRYVVLNAGKIGITLD